MKDLLDKIYQKLDRIESRLSILIIVFIVFAILQYSK